MSKFFVRGFAIFLCFLHNYFNGPTKLFSNLYLAKFLDISAKLFFLRSQSSFYLFNLAFLNYLLT